jgi:hypothetical protein
MRGHRLLFVLAALFALGLIGFANFPGDRHAVADTEASQLVGGAVPCTNSVLVSCGGDCQGTCYSTNTNGTVSACGTRVFCAGNALCALVYNTCGGG